MNKKINIDDKKIKDEILNLKKTLMNLNFQKSSGQLEKTSKIKDTKKQIARLNTKLLNISKLAQAGENKIVNFDFDKFKAFEIASFKLFT